MSISAFSQITALERFLFGEEEPDFSNTYRGRTVQPQNAYCWEFKFKGVEGEFKQDARLYAQQVSIPAMEQEPVVKEYRGKRIAYQGKNSSPLELNVTFYDTEDLAMYKTIYKWFRSMNELRKNNSVNPESFSVGFTSSGYLKSCEITLLDTKERNATAKYVFDRVFPISLGEVSLDYASSEIMTFDVKFSYFDVDVEFEFVEDSIFDYWALV